MKRYVSPNSSWRSFSRFRICAWIETSSAETGSSQTSSFGPSAKRARDPDALPLAAGELVGIAVRVARVEADDVEQLANAGGACATRTGAVHDQRLRDDVADGHPRVERRVRILEDDLHVAAQFPDLASRQFRQLLAHEPHRAARRLDQLEDAVAGCRLPGAGLADEAERLALGDLEADAVDGLDRAHRALEQQAFTHGGVLRQVGDDEKRLAHVEATAGSLAG